jgi:hypothetical protein
MARLVRAIHNPLSIWMARIKRAMTKGGKRENYFFAAITLISTLAPRSSLATCTKARAG